MTIYRIEMVRTVGDTERARRLRAAFDALLEHIARADHQHASDDGRRLGQESSKETQHAQSTYD